MFQIFCIKVDGDNIPPHISDFLLVAASNLYKEKRKYSKVSNDECEGFISTQYAYGGLVGIYGIIFKGEVSWLNKTSKIEFVCKEKELEALPENRVTGQMHVEYSDIDFSSLN